MCRYKSEEYYKYRVRCYCSGALYTYLEFGEICTRFSLQKHPPASGKYGNAPLIQPPFNWGDKPTKAVTEDGKPYPIVPVYTSASLALFSSEPDSEFDTIEDAVNDLADRMRAHLSEKLKNENVLFSALRYQLFIPLCARCFSNNVSLFKFTLGYLPPVRGGGGRLQNQKGTP